MYRFHAAASKVAETTLHCFRKRRKRREGRCLCVLWRGVGNEVGRRGSGMDCVIKKMKKMKKTVLLFWYSVDALQTSLLALLF